MRRRPSPRRNDGLEVSYHDSCHMLRELGIRDAPRRLLLASGATIRPLPRPDLCCGFGGTFAVRQPEISVSMADDKLAGSARILVTSDPGCLMHLHGRAQSRSALTSDAASCAHRNRTRPGGRVVSRLDRPAGAFRDAARRNLEDAHIQDVLDAATGMLREIRVNAWDQIEDIESLREQGRRARSRAIRDLPRYLDQFEANIHARGGQVRRCATDEEARAAIVEICLSRGAKLVAKSKSMATEEIAINEALEARGIKAVETDLGEYILQLAGEHPPHIVAPAIEKTAHDVAQLLEAVDGEAVEPVLGALTAKARRQLREVFLNADVGITGANFAVAETGSICLVTNEGNAGLVTTLPPVHIVLWAWKRSSLTSTTLLPACVCWPEPPPASN